MCDFEQCPTCRTSQPVSDCALGVLGSLVHFRCRYCGDQWASHIDSLPEYDLDVPEPGDLLEAEV